MKKLISILQIYALVAMMCSPAFASTGTTVQADVYEGGSNTLINPSGARSTAGYAASGGTFTTGGTGANTYFSWDSSAAGQTILSGYQTVSSGDAFSGRNGVVSAAFKCASGTCTHKLQVWDGSNKINEATITSSTTNFVPTSVNFIYPASGVVAWRLISVAADEPTVYWREGVRGRADGFNLGSGQITTPTKENGSNYTISGFGTISNLKVYEHREGEYLVVTGYFTQGTTAATTASIQLPSNYTIDPTKIPTGAGGTKVGDFGRIPGTAENIYSSNDIEVLFYDGSTNNTLYVAKDAGTTSYNKNTGASVGASSQPANFNFRVPIAQFTDQPYYKAEQTPASWSGYHNGISGGCASSSTTYADTSACTGITLNQTTARNITCTTASGSLPGIDCVLARAGIHSVCVDISYLANASSAYNSYRLMAGSTVMNPGKSRQTISGGTTQSDGQICGTYNASSGGTVTFKLQLAASAGTVSLQNGIASGSAALNWVVNEGDAPMAAPYLMGSVTSNSTGQYRLESAIIAESGSCGSSPCTVSRQTSSWIVSNGVTRSSNGTYAVDYTGAFSAAPICWLQNYGGGVGFNICRFQSALTSTTASILCDNLGGTPTDTNFSISCMGPR